jgi:hypothetical protein
MPPGARVNPGVPDFEQRLSSLQTSERLEHGPTDDAASTEQRLALLTEECAEIVRRWALTSERHARAVTRFEGHLTEWNDAGARLQQDAAQRIEQLQQLIQQEWSELKELHEAPVRQLSEHATSLTQVCIATANAAQQGFERSEARLAAIETELNRRLGELTREVHSVVAELKAGSDSIGRLPAPARAWSLEGVTQLHHQLRTADGTATPEEPPAMRPAAPPVAGLLPEAAGALTTRIESLERALTERDSTLKDTTARSSRSLRLALSAAAFVLVIGALIAVQLNGDVHSATQRAEQAERAQAAATADAKKQISEVSRTAAEQIAEASKRAAQAQLVSEVLAAPDLARFALAGRRALTGLEALVSWSPTRGVVFSGSLMPAPPAGATYQLWLVTRAGATSAATFTPDASGVATVSAHVPPAMRGVVGAAMVTLEAEGGRTAPVGPVVFARPVVTPPAETP